ncbi:hypothetical protein Tco_0248234 [Tanacetum coccineum]
MPKGSKVLKDLLSHKEKLKKAASSVKLSEECSVIIQRSLPQKEGDPGSFTLPCLIRPLAVKNALTDLVLMDEDELVPIILGRPFLATARAVIDVHEGKLSPRVGIISSALSIVEKAKFLEVLRNHKGAIAWSIADIKGIESSFCTHKILMEDEFKPSVQPQRRVNPNIKEVVLKKGGMTVRIRRKPHSPALTEPLHTNECLSDYAMLQQPFSANHEKMLRRCEETNLVLNWEKCHFMVKEEIFLGHKVSDAGIEADKAKIKAILKLPYPTNVKAI